MMITLNAIMAFVFFLVGAFIDCHTGATSALWAKPTDEPVKVGRKG